MKKVVIALTAAVATFSAGMANATSHTISVGYAQTQARIAILKTTKPVSMPGVNLKYNWESNGKWGVISSFSYTTKNVAGVTLTGVSLTAGPSFRFNDFVKGYALIGGGYGRVNAGNVYTSETGGSYGAGLQVNPHTNIAIDASYVYTSLSGSGSESARAGTWMLGVGYRF